MSSSFVYINQNNELEKTTFISPTISGNISTLSPISVIWRLSFTRSTPTALIPFVIAKGYDMYKKSSLTVLSDLGLLASASCCFFSRYF